MGARVFWGPALSGPPRSLAPRFLGRHVFCVPALSRSAFSGAPRFLRPRAFSLRIFWGPAFSDSAFSYFFKKRARGPQKRGAPGICHFCHRLNPALNQFVELNLSYKTNSHQRRLIDEFNYELNSCDLNATYMKQP